MPSVYLAGPMVFRPDAAAVYAEMRAVCGDLGLAALTPIDGTLDMTLAKGELARAIKHANIALIRRCQGVVACISPFRGPGADAGTAWEMGYAEAMGKPVTAWTTADGFYAPRATLSRNPAGEPVDADGLVVEDFDLADNLMLTADIEVLASFREAAAAMARKLRASP